MAMSEYTQLILSEYLNELGITRNYVLLAGHSPFDSSTAPDSEYLKKIIKLENCYHIQIVKNSITEDSQANIDIDTYTEIEIEIEIDEEFHFFSVSEKLATDMCDIIAKDILSTDRVDINLFCLGGQNPSESIYKLKVYK